MAFKTFIVALGVFLAGYAVSLDVPPEVLEKLGGIVPESLSFLGSVDGRAFFIENTKMNWTDALKVCNESRMQLASVTSEEQQMFLKNAWESNFFDGHYWTSGRDAGDFRQFVWHYTNASVDGSTLSKIGNLTNLVEEESCMGIYVPQRGSRWLFQYQSYECSLPLLNVLCEI